MNPRYCNGMIHVIKRGENLYQLSRMYRVPLALILRANPYIDVYNLQPGQEICIPTARPQPGRPPQQPPAPPQPQSGMPPESGMPAQSGMSSQNEMAPDDAEQEEDSARQMGVMTEMQGTGESEEQKAGNSCNEVERQPETVESRLYVADGTESLGRLLREHNMSWQEFGEQNDLDSVILAADVAVYLPKKV